MTKQFGQRLFRLLGEVVYIILLFYYIYWECQQWRAKWLVHGYFITAPDFPFVLNRSFEGLFIIPPYENVQFAADSTIVKTTIQGSPYS